MDNDAYTNMEAVVVLRAALECAERLDETPPAAWAHVARELVIPKDATRQVLLNYEGYEPKCPRQARSSLSESDWKYGASVGWP